jgi:hypothetical protein
MRKRLFEKNTALGKATPGELFLLPALHSLLFAEQRRFDSWQ